MKEYKMTIGSEQRRQSTLVSQNSQQQQSSDGDRIASNHGNNKVNESTFGKMTKTGEQTEREYVKIINRSGKQKDKSH